MAYYSVRISGGADVRGVGFKTREQFGGRNADDTGNPNFFYVERRQNAAALQRNVESYVGDEYEVEVNEISEDEFEWRRRR